MIYEPSKNYLVQLNLAHSEEKKYISFNNLNTALLNDPDLSSLPRESLGVP